MTDIRKNRGKGNSYGEAWHNSPLWKSIDKPVKTDECRHNKIVWSADGKTCKECGVKL